MYVYLSILIIQTIAIFILSIFLCMKNRPKISISSLEKQIKEMITKQETFEDYIQILTNELSAKIEEMKSDKPQKAKRKR